MVGGAGFEPAKAYTNRFTVCPRWPLEYPPDMLLCVNRLFIAQFLESQKY